MALTVGGVRSIFRCATKVLVSPPPCAWHERVTSVPSSAMVSSTHPALAVPFVIDQRSVTGDANQLPQSARPLQRTSMAGAA